MKRLLLKILNRAKRLLSIDNKYRHSSYSQCGEDLIVKFIFDQIKISTPSYLDVGAYHPKYISNTYLFYKNGSSGVCVEPNPELLKIIKKTRKKDTCLGVGIGINTSNSMVDFYAMSSNTLSTFSKLEADRLVHEEGENIKSILKIPLISINKIIEDNFESCPNFISLDIEGLDFDVLKSFNFEKYRPEVFCVETLTYKKGSGEEKLKDISSFLQEKSYLVYADTYINTIFVDSNTWNNR